MGILSSTVGLPVTGPMRGLLWIARKVAEKAETDYYDPAHVQTALRSLEDRLALREIDDAEFEREEERLLDRLEEIIEHNKMGERDHD